MKQYVFTHLSQTEFKRFILAHILNNGGPEFLWKPEFQLPSDETPELEIGDPEAVRAVARILRCISKNKSKDLTKVEERENAESVIIRNLQRQAFQNELGLLSKDIPLPSNNRLHRLNAFIDKDGVLKTGFDAICVTVRLGVWTQAQGGNPFAEM
ncbi:hypothetical protein NFI96_000344 [Prochilodus magdalenae]|nr:hypothetical protein NFI96_000344 [Prochilodus magdalenae]